MTDFCGVLEVNQWKILLFCVHANTEGDDVYSSCLQLQLFA